MKRHEIRVCILRVGGTNCDMETKYAFEDLGVQADILHVNHVVKHRSLMEYNALVLPGGFSYGDYVRAGAIWAKWMLAKMGRELMSFVDEGRPVLGICNGFQVLVEAGLLPAFDGIAPYPEAVLAPNNPPGFHCRWVYIRHENNGKCIFTAKIPKGQVLRIPVAHAEGRFLFPKETETRCLKRLIENDQLVFRYCTKEGVEAGGKYPYNPNGSLYDIAGICSPEGTVLGLMPHPERAFYWWQLPDWTRQSFMPQYGDGKLLFESIINHLEKKF
ncbi:MAG: phosphoribosylformylglycinamidine synthase subunit PurQ [Candidatus Bathyarchaeota archaeon]|nr:phosphoribosylformylglycinamidine synthase subunit PurQ [Candidatus Bathyarchaeota archaeon]MCX8177411.1 phosphoribosylformylglycinamidine synthase subunit PurQ [Candidatus Bathyarchaeota archaeon]MDW8193858.1 phosphoribosylformylglycinamidine synthase subunit PurQ [Nitrososphaerota archaeon]